MAGIECFGAYVPLFRLDYQEVTKAWGVPAGKGERAVAGGDEDSLTMAVEAAVDCLKDRDRAGVDGVFFASTTSPFQEKQAAATMATALDLKRAVCSVDFGGSLRSGTSALKAGLDAVGAGSNRQVVVAAADCRLGFPNTPLEYMLGDGAAAFLVTDSDTAVRVAGTCSIADEMMDYWRRAEDRFVHSWEDRFILTEGFERVVPEAVKSAFQTYDLKPADFTKFVSSAPVERSYWQVAGKLGFDLKTQVQAPLFSVMGHTGAAFSLMQLVACLEEAKPGDRILFASYGNGCDVFILEVAERIGKAHGRKGLGGLLASRKAISNYEQYAALKGLIPQMADRMPPIRVPATTVWRDQNSILRFHGMKCNHCGHVQIPIHRICSNCSTKDDYREVRFSDQIAKVFSCTVDNLGYGAGTKPFWAIADFEDVRTRIQITDADLQEVKIGDPLEMTFRRFPSENDVPVYGWKARRIR